MKIAVVANDSELIDQLKKLFKNVGISVEEVASGEEAFKKTSSGEYHLIICDSKTAKSIFRKQNKASDYPVLKFLDLDLNSAKRIVTRAKAPVKLNPKEFDLLELFMTNPGRVFTKAQLLKRIFNYDFDPQTNVVDVLVCRLRKKIDGQFNVKVIQTIRGVGYGIGVRKP